MTKTVKATIEVQGVPITVVPHEGHDFISLTVIARYKNPDHPDDVVRNWLRNRSTVEFLGIWERLNNPAFNPVEFDGIRSSTMPPFLALTSSHKPTPCPPSHSSSS